ncbi:hypothetical protein JCM33374_g3902 [Metschnikowia sp. JCM 33374]|nr:hypothetical protein JCM33374_g3902 [Metschnikowia sp. JCM 33374]
MQGSYKNNGLPRPYYMKPSKRGSVYDKMPRHAFLTNSRKLTGYIIMLFLFGLCVFLISQEFKVPADTSYEIVGSNSKSSSDKNSGDVGKFVDSAIAGDLENDKTDLAQNRAQNSKGEYGHAVMEAPKGGMVNEAHIVGNDEDLIVDGKTKKNSHDDASIGKGKGFKAEREETTPQKKPTPGKQISEVSNKNEGNLGTETDFEKLNKPLKKSDNVKEILEESKNQ